MSTSQPAYPNPNSELLQGVIERLTYHSSESGYTVARLKAPRSHELITIVGNFATIQPGQTLQLQGYWKDHPKFGPQFQVTRYQETKPATLTGLEKYLGSGLIKGVGPVTARRIVDHFGLDTLEIIESSVERLIEVPGIAQKRVEIIRQAWKTQKIIKDVMLFLQSHGVSTVYAVKIFKHYGQDAITTVTQNPYQLATDIYGIGFITADGIARKLGITPDSEFRYRAGILYTLGQAGEDGHCFLPFTELVEQGINLLELPDYQPEEGRIIQQITPMALNEEIILQGGTGEWNSQHLCYKPAFYRAEQSLAEQVYTLLQQPITVDLPRVEGWIQRFIQKTGIHLSEQQQRAVMMAASQRLLILTGGPGTGKTFTTRTIVALWKAMGKTIALAAPTGRAAQRLTEMTGQEAKTLHRLLEFEPQSHGFKRDGDYPIDAQAIVVDETSMVDLFLANSLLKAVASDAQLLLVGDGDQLPSVGPGSVLNDLIKSRLVPVIQLTEVFRQAQSSQIVVNAHAINQGEFPQLESVSNNPRSDCLWLGAPEPETGVQAIQDLLTDFIPTLGFNPQRDVQVLSPMMRGAVGTRQLNLTLQEFLNPSSPDKSELTRGSLRLRVGDRVIQQKNNYDREVFNGDLGEVTTIDLEQQEIHIEFGGRSVIYDYADLTEISLAWSITIHKSQGSEYPVVILPLYMQHYLLLNRNLIYTALTRAKELAILVGPKKAIALAVNQVSARERYTFLPDRLLAQTHMGTFEGFVDHL